MIKKSLLLIFLLFPILASAQTKNHNLYFRSGEISPIENSTDWQKILTNKKNIYNHKAYLCLQFYDIPTQSQKNEIKARGIELFAYMPRFAYLAAVPENMSTDELQKLNLRSLVELTYLQKLHPQLEESDFPIWAATPEGKIKVKLLVYPSIQLSEAKEVLMASFNVSNVLSNDLFHQLTLETDPVFLHTLAEIPFVQFIELTDPPSYPENYTARTSHRTNILSSEYSSGKHYDGSGIQIALGDDGIIGPHIDYEGRIASLHVSKNTGNHGDHVAGTIMGAGNLDPVTKGMSPGAEIHVYDVWDAIDSSTYSYYNLGITLTSISYSNGCNAGYTKRANAVDQQVRLMPSLLPVFSAGNEGATDCGYGAGAGWGNVTGGIKIGKNVLAVANLDLIDQLNSSSSRGPASDGRIKPDISAVGTNVYSTITPNDYDTYTGTSMACPGVSGTLASLYDAYDDLYSGLPESALMKAILLNSADDVGNPGPDFKFGWGRMNARRSLKTLEEGRWFTDSLIQNESKIHSITIPSGASEFRIMVYWTDYEGTINSSIALVNDIDITVTAPDLSEHKPWLLNAMPDTALLNSYATTGLDTLNNMEQIAITNPAPGTYLLNVFGSEIPDGTQHYFVVYEFLDSTIILTHPIGGETFVPKETELIRWDSYGGTGNFTAEYSADTGNTWTTITSSIPSKQRYFYWQIPDTISGNCLVRVSRGNIYDESDTTFSIINTPKNLAIDTACMNYIVLSWDSVPGAASYDIFQLGNTYMDSISNTSLTSYTVAITNPYTDYEWFAVRARGNNEAVGRRCIAISLDSLGIKNCILNRDLELTAISSPEAAYPSCVSSSTIPISLNITNTGKQDIATIEVGYQLTGYAAVTEQYVNTIAAGATVSYTFTQPLAVSTVGQYRLHTWISDTSSENNYNDTLSMYFEILNNSTITTPFLQDFEDFSLCDNKAGCYEDSCFLSEGWTNLANDTLDDTDWRVNEGETPSDNTGPSKDHTLNTVDGNYVYLEATDCYNQTAKLFSPCIDLTGTTTPVLNFWYHMFGQDMGELQVDIFSEGSWSHNVYTQSGSQGSPWRNKEIDLKDYVNKTIVVCFKAISGTNFKSDIALDDIAVLLQSSIRDQDKRATNIEVWPNPSNGIFTVALHNAWPAEIEMSLTDISGKTVFSSATEKVNANDERLINLDFLADGIYLLKISIDNHPQHIKLSKQ